MLKCFCYHSWTQLFYSLYIHLYFFTIHSSVPLRIEKQNLSLQKNGTHAALYHLLRAERAPLPSCSWNCSKLEVLRTPSRKKCILFPQKILRQPHPQDFYQSPNTSVLTRGLLGVFSLHSAYFGIVLLPETVFWSRLWKRRSWGCPAAICWGYLMVQIFSPESKTIPTESVQLRLPERCWKIWQGAERPMKFP